MVSGIRVPSTGWGCELVLAFCCLPPCYKAICLMAQRGHKVVPSLLENTSRCRQRKQGVEVIPVKWPRDGRPKLFASLPMSFTKSFGKHAIKALNQLKRRRINRCCQCPPACRFFRYLARTGLVSSFATLALRRTSLLSSAARCMVRGLVSLLRLGVQCTSNAMHCN